MQEKKQFDLNYYSALAAATNLPQSEKHKFQSDEKAYMEARPVLNYFRRVIGAFRHSAGLADLVKRSLFYGEKFRLALLPEDGMDLNPIVNVTANRERVDFLHGVIGVMTEAGELAEILDNFMVGFHAGDTPLSSVVNKTHVMEEVGDIMWYLPLIANSCGFTLNEAAAANIRKLRKRYPDGFNHLAAQFRDLAAELEQLDQPENG